MSTTEEKILIGASRLRNMIHREMGRHFGEYGLTTAQFSILEVLYSKGDMSVGEIRERILGTPGNVPGIINHLAEAGYVVKTQDEKDKRISRISITDSGNALMGRIYPHPHHAWLEEILSPLTSEEKDLLADVLEKSCGKIQNAKARLKE